MKCWSCGAEIAQGARFCQNCGADQQQAQPSYGQGSQQGPQQSWQQVPPQTPPTRGVPSGNDTVLKIFAAICAVLYGVAAVRGLIFIVTDLFRFPFRTSVILILPFSLLAVVLNVFMCLVLVMFALRRTPRNSDGLLVLLGAGAAVIVVLQFVLLGLRLITYPYRYGLADYLAAFAFNAFSAVFVVAIVYSILRFVMGEFPLAGKGKDELLQEVRETLDALGQTASEAAQGAKSSWDANQQARQAQQQEQQTRWQGQNYAQPDPYGQTPSQPGPYGQTPGQPGPYGQTPGQPGPYGQTPGQPGPYGQSAPPPNGYPYPTARLKTDRSLVSYILLTFLTCGIYGLYFIYSIAQDVNIACAGDGKQTAGLLKLLLLSFLTCGIYGWFWYYSLGNRLAANAPRYGLSFQENGTTVLLWFLLGSLLCGIGAFVAIHILIKNTNAICAAYNYQHGI